MEEKKNQEETILFHNVHYVEASPISARANINTEQKAVRWAQHKVTTIEDVLTRNGNRMLTATEFQARHPEIANDVAMYRMMLQVIPQAWHDALKTPNHQAHHDQEVW